MTPINSGGGYSAESLNIGLTPTTPSSRPSSGGGYRGGGGSSVDYLDLVALADVDEHAFSQSELENYRAAFQEQINSPDLTSDDLASLVGQMTKEEYDEFIRGTESYYDEQIKYFGVLLNGDDGLKDLYDTLEDFRISTDIDTIKFGQDERVNSDVNFYVDNVYTNYNEFWEEYEKENGLEYLEGYEAYQEMTHDEKVEFLKQHSPEVQEIIAKNEAFYAEILDSKVEAKLSDLGIHTYAEYEALRASTKAEIDSLEEMIKTSQNLRDSAKYDYLYYLDDYNNFNVTPINPDDYMSTLAADASASTVFYDGMVKQLKVYSYEDYKEKHPEVTPSQFMQMVQKDSVGCDYSVSGIPGASDVAAIASVSEFVPSFAKIYDYLYSKNPEEAKQYLQDCRYEINNIKGQLMAEEFLSSLGVLDGSDDEWEAVANELGVSVEGLMDGLNSFGEGIGYTFEALLTALGICEENRVMSPEEYKRMYILQGLLAQQAKLDLGLIYSGEDGQLHNTDPNSVIDYTRLFAGAFLSNNYEISQGIGNMAPSILLSTFCPAAGSWAMGISAGGNAYHGAMVEGYDYVSALFYGIYSGASEAITERLIGGLPGLSDVQVTSFKTYLKAIAHEGGEEVFQDVMDSVYRAVMMGEPLPTTLEEWKEYGEGLIKSGAYGAITAGILQSPSLMGSTLRKRRFNKMATAIGLTTELINPELKNYRASHPELASLTDEQLIVQYGGDILLSVIIKPVVPTAEQIALTEQAIAGHANMEVGDLATICTQVTREQMKSIILSVPQDQRVQLIFAIEQKLANGKFESTFISYREHAELHTLAVQEYAERLGKNISDLTPAEIEEIKLASYFHDLGMAGGIFAKDGQWRTTEDGFKARKNHPLNSAIDIIEFDLVPEGMDAEKIALLAMSHSKSTSGIKHMSSVSEWLGCVSKLDEALMRSRGYGLDPDAKARLVGMINDPAQLAILQKEAMCIRDGDAMSPIALDENNNTIMQTGNTSHVEVERLSGPNEAPQPYIMPDFDDEARTFVGADKIKDTIVETGQPVESPASRIIHAGELNVEFHSDVDSTGTSYSATATVHDSLSSPEANIYTINERMGEVITYDHLDQRTYTIELPAVDGQSIEGTPLGDWYVQTVDTLKTDYLKKASGALEATAGTILGSKKQGQEFVASLVGIDATDPGAINEVISQYNLEPETASILMERCIEYGKAHEFIEQGVQIEFLGIKPQS